MKGGLFPNGPAVPQHHRPPPLRAHSVAPYPPNGAGKRLWYPGAKAPGPGLVCLWAIDISLRRKKFDWIRMSVGGIIGAATVGL
jgi:hypothetical protein